MEQLYKDKEDNFYGYKKEGTEPTTKAYYEKVMARKKAEYEAQPEVKKAKAQSEVDAVLGDMSTAEAMYYMLQYAQAKATPTSDASDDANTIPTPTDEDIITWGDRISNELDEKIRVLRKL